jgi:hypothetical protein
MRMAQLRHRLAEFGFESNDDYDFALRCLFETPTGAVRLLNPVGESGRRKTAFAHALAHALDYPHLLYLDFSRPPAPVEPKILDVADNNDVPLEAPPTPFERAMVEACAFSEGARVVLILDQLHAADFADQVRLYQFAASAQWAQGKARAHSRNLLLIVVSEQPLYHSLAKLAWRIHTDSSAQSFDAKPADFGWPASAMALFAALAALFELLGRAPTTRETQHLLADLNDRVRTAEQLRIALFGRMEGLDRERLYAPALANQLQQVVDRMSELIGIDEIVVQADESLDSSDLSGAWDSGL